MRVEERISVDPEPDMVALFEKASNYVWMSSALYPAFYDRENVRQAFRSSAERVNVFDLLLGANVDWDQRKLQLPWLAELVSCGRIKARKSNARIPHWLVIDGKHFRLEKKHHEDVFETSNLIVWSADKPIADMLQERFIRWWRNASPID